MSNEPDNVYSTPVPRSLTRLMDALTFPHHVSCEILGRLSFASLLDVGAGKDIRLAEYVLLQRGAAYTALDRGQEEVDGQVVTFATIMRERLQARGLEARVLPADARAMPADAGPVDVSHARFIFMHLGGQDRRRVLENMLAVTRRHVVLLDYSWRTLDSASHPALMSRFVTGSFELMARLNADPFVGEALPGLAESVAAPRDVRVEAFDLPEGDHSEQIDILCRLQSDLADAIRRPDLAAEFQHVEAGFRTARDLGEPIRMTSARIHAVIIDC